MANTEHVAKFKEGLKCWNQWRISDPAGAELRPRGLDLSMMSFRGANLVGGDFRGVNLSGSDLSRCDLRQARMNGADLSRARLREVDATGAEFTDVDLTLAVLIEGNFAHSNLLGAKLVEADLRGSNCSAANLMYANMRGAYLAHANLRGANFRGAKLASADLTNADLEGAALDWANLAGSNLTGANLNGASFSKTTFGATTLGGAKGLETCRHSGPSHLDFDTLSLTDSLPLNFLRGCGLPDSIITYLPSLMNQPIQFYSCFISYSTKDQDFADRLYADLQNKGVRCWFAPHDIRGGLKIHDQIDEAIRVYQRLLLILSPSSMSSEWVKTEIAKARRRETQEKRRMLFPVRLTEYEVLRDWECFDADAGKDSAREIREYYIPDFSNWKDHDSYHKEFEKLLRDLRAEQK